MQQSTERLHLVYPVLPPSANHIYIRGTVLKREAREYKAAFKQWAVQNHMHDISNFAAGSDLVYGLHLAFFFDSLVNESYNDKTKPPSRRAKTRYKRLDLDNRVKFLQDCIRDVIDVDDSRIFAASQEKHQDPINPRVEIVVQSVDPTLFGIEEDIPM